MKVFIFLIAIATAVAVIDLPVSAPVPVFLEDATPADVLLYLYDVVLLSHTDATSSTSGQPSNSELSLSTQSYHSHEH